MASHNCESCEELLFVDGVGYQLCEQDKKAAEREFYDESYDMPGTTEGSTEIRTLFSEWDRPDQPQNKIVREYLGDISDDVVLMLGNGASYKELTFLMDAPRKLIYSDLSLNASRRLRSEFDLQGYDDQLITASIDAESLPFDDESVDVVYAYAMVHHLPNLDLFFAEVHRVLRPGGKAVFMDDAHSAPWAWAKFGPLKRLMRYSHSSSGISPEDYRFSMSGGFKEPELAKQIKRVGGEPFFQRTSFANYILCRGSEKCLPKKVSKWVCRGFPARAAQYLDRLGARANFYRDWQIRLVWGFVKPKIT